MKSKIKWREFFYNLQQLVVEWKILYLCFLSWVNNSEKSAMF